MSIYVVTAFIALLSCASCVQGSPHGDNQPESRTVGATVQPDTISVNIADVAEPEQYPLRPTYGLTESKIPINGELVTVKQIVITFFDAEDDYDFAFQESEQGPALVLTKTGKGLIALPRNVINPELNKLTPVVAYVLKYKSGKIDRWMPTSFQLPGATAPVKLPKEGTTTT